VNAVFWSWTGLGAIPAALVGAALGAWLGVQVGAGRVQSAWAGTVGAFLIPAVAFALVDIVVLFVLGAGGH
jgi:hypothetical protein